ncbi:hypothetical protein PHAVU_008G073500 [Phaseolus vulgaris]|uniref:F-box domain-containing protein n=2 Tax=Phaseolus vulgaris TaxID=3885 RepID=V7B224_PHAVU|nr:hypothetical protein PHAVU_008G073500g [Phaseolus vulgaris]ESW11957.1 hypothetical protein PHAVU_008G073500g [Phaseolus vulgaris]
MKKMKSSAGNVRNTNNDLMHEILVKIFLCLNVVDVAVASLVCKSWNKASREPSLWNKIDLSTLGSYCFRKPLNKIEAYRHSSLKMTQFLKHVLDLSNGSTTCLIFNFYVYLTNEQFILVAQGTPKLKRVVLPETGDFSRGVVETVMSLWSCLESITITSGVSGYYTLLAIGKYCNNITEMKFSQGCYFEEKHAVAMAKHTPKLKILSIRTVATSVKALFCVLRFLEHLEKVNICHSLIMDTAYPGTVFVDIRELRRRFPASSVEKLLYCERGSCLRCINGRDTTPSRQPDGPYEDIWGEDEITSLAHLPQPS